MYFILSKPDDCFLLVYDHGLVLNHIHNLSPSYLVLYCLYCITSCLCWMPRWKSQPKSPKAHLTPLYFFFFLLEVQICFIVSWIIALKITVSFFYFLLHAHVCYMVLLSYSWKCQPISTHTGPHCMSLSWNLLICYLKKLHFLLPLNNDLPLTKASLT